MDTEERAANTILQKDIKVTIGGKIYDVAPPTVGTLIMASAEIAKLPQKQPIKDKESGEVNMLDHVLYIAKDCTVIGNIMAILILGAKGVTEKREVITKKYFGLIRDSKIVEINHKEILAKEILENLSPKKLNEVLALILNSLQVGFFFTIINSLVEINLLKKSK